MIYYCPRAFSEDCTAEKCSFYATAHCIEGQVSAQIVSSSGGQVISCPRANTPSCNEMHCSLWGTSRCNEGLVNIAFEI
ncbi:MAG: hypothetical protein R2864_05635 [Syntrophotaleaceae bacterium]